MAVQTAVDAESIATGAQSNFSPPKAPATLRGFSFLQSSPKRLNAHHSHPIPGTIIHLRTQSRAAFPPRVNLKYSHPQQNQSSHYLNPIDTNIPSTQLPNTSPPIAISDTISSPKPRRILVPLLRDLIKPDIKRKRQLHLPL
jgi:hypothetical protein